MLGWLELRGTRENPFGAVFIGIMFFLPWCWPSPALGYWFAHLDLCALEREDARVRSVRSGQPIPIAPTGWQLTARRLQAARPLAGRPSVAGRARSKRPARQRTAEDARVNYSVGGRR
jgi:hypothetical protein